MTDKPMVKQSDIQHDSLSTIQSQARAARDEYIAGELRIHLSHLRAAVSRVFDNVFSRGNTAREA